MDELTIAWIPDIVAIVNMTSAMLANVAYGTSVTFTPDGKALVTGHDNSTAQITPVGP